MACDDKSSKTKTNEKPANKVRGKTPPFYVDKLELCFYEVEAQLAISGFKSEEIKFNYFVAQFEPKFMENIWDIIKDTKFEV